MALGANDKFGFGKLFVKDPKAKPSVAVVDRRAKEKAERFKSLKDVLGSKQALRRARRGVTRRSIVEQLQHSTETPIHPLWTYLPRESRSQQSLFQLRLRRLSAWLKESRQRISIVLIIYVVIWLIPLLLGQPLITVFAFLPLVLVPPIGYLIYWLVWQEFHT